MAENVIIFEDERVQDLGAIALMRPACELLCGLTSLREKMARRYKGARVTFAVRPYLREVYSEHLSAEGVKAEVMPFNEVRLDRPALLVNGRLLALEPDRLPSAKGPNEAVYARVARRDAVTGEQIESYDELVCLRTDGASAPRLGTVLAQPWDWQDRLAGLGYKVRQTEQAQVIRYPWDIIMANGEAVAADFERLHKPGLHGRVSPRAYVLYHSRGQVREASFAELVRRKRLSVRILVEKDAVVEPGVVFDLMAGPVYVGEGAKVSANSRIDGPSCIGRGTIIDTALIRQGCSFGPVCRIGGEVEGSVFQGYSNKHHDGFLGHAFVAEWVNIGALATNSDLKNTYGAVRVPITAQRAVNSGQFKTVGCYIGDHTKIAICLAINTGTHIGVGCNLFGAMPPKYVPSFCWGNPADGAAHKRDKMAATAATVMSRRKKAPSQAYRNLLAYLWDATAGERQQPVAAAAD